jgi:thioredoxin reductase (NADPH)
MNTSYFLALYALPVAYLIGRYLVRRNRREAGQREALSESIAAGLAEPVSLHPVVDSARCVGSASCVSACPERAIGVVDGLARLVDPAACIGHGACVAACPFDAIQLVFGTEKRGVDIPQVGPDFQTNVPGVFIAGELGGMGLIAKAAGQGQRAMSSIGRRRGAANELDVVIVGAGPAGLAASLAAKELGLRYVMLEQEATFGGSILHYPRRKLTMTSPMKLPLVGRVSWREVRKEALVEFWTDVVRRQELKVRFREPMIAIERDGESFVVPTPRARYRARNVLLSLGRRGTPRKLGVPGEELPKVVYRLVDSSQYSGRRVLVVGGGDSAIEAALAVAAEPGTQVALSYRNAAFDRIKPKNRQRLESTRGIRVLFESKVVRISPTSVEMEQRGQPVNLANDDILVCAGGELPTALLKSIGVLVETHYGTAPAHARSPKAS